MRTATVASLALAAHALAQPNLAIRSVDLIDVETGTIHENQTILIEGGTIHSMGPETMRVPDGIDIINADGLYAIPGLWDAHVHFTTSPEVFGPRMIGYGVTYARDTGADTTAILNVRSQSTSTDRIMPQLFCTGAIIDGDPPVWPFSEACDTPDDARAAVQKLHKAGVDQIKVYSRLKQDVYEAAIAEAHSLGLKVTGHIPAAVPLADALEAGHNCNEHLTGFPQALALAAGLDEAPGSLMTGQDWTVYDDVPQAERDELAMNVADAGMVQCPTLTVFVGYATALEEDVQHPELDALPSYLTQWWGNMGASPVARSMKIAIPRTQQLVGDLHRAGVTILAGTDLANPYIYPGWSLHHELEMLSEAGLSPADCLRSATILPAEFCGVDDHIGAVRSGYDASIVLLSENPLEDITATRAIEHVIMRGRHFDRSTLDEMLESQQNAPQPQQAQAADVDLTVPGEIRRGRYNMKFGEFDAGHEDFAIGRTDKGWTIRSATTPQGGPQLPSNLTINLTPDRDFISAEWTQQSSPPLHATYTLVGDTLNVHAKTEDAEIPPFTLDLPEGAIMYPPSISAELAFYHALNLSHGDEKEFPIVSWGFPNYVPQISSLTVTRQPDTTIDYDNRTVEVAHYTWILDTGMGKLNGTSWVSDKGLPVRTFLKLPYGTVTNELQP